MKTSEFIKRVEDLGYSVLESVSGKTLLIRVKEDGDEYSIASVGHSEAFDMNTGWQKGMNEDLFDLVVEYARTPIEERDETKLYTASHKAIDDKDYSFLNYDLEDEVYFMSDVKDEFKNFYRRRFTKEQLENVNGINIFESNEWEILEVNNEES